MRGKAIRVFLIAVAVALLSVLAFRHWMRLPWLAALPIAALFGVGVWTTLAWLLKLESNPRERLSQLLTIASTAVGLLFLSMSVSRSPDLVLVCRDLPAQVPSFEVDAIKVLETRMGPVFPIQLELANRGTAAAREPEVYLRVEEPLFLDRIVLQEGQRRLSIPDPLQRLTWEKGAYYREIRLKLPSLLPNRRLDLHVRLARLADALLPLRATLYAQTDANGEDRDFRFVIRINNQGEATCAPE